MNLENAVTETRHGSIVLSDRTSDDCFVKELFSNGRQNQRGDGSPLRMQYQEDVLATISLITNLAALATERRLSANTAELRKTFDRLSSGLRITKASDDAAGLAISESLKTDSCVLNQGVRNLNDAVSLANIADAALNELNSIVMRLRELAEQSSNGTLGHTQRGALNAEAEALSSEFSRVSRSAAFNGQGLFDGSLQSLRLQAGYGTDGGLDALFSGKMGDGTLSIGAAFSVIGDSNWTGTALGDLNGDGILDAVISNSYFDAPYSLTIRTGNGDGTFGAARSFAGGYFEDIMLSDLNNDGWLDIATLNASSFVEMRFNRGDGSFTSVVSVNSLIVTNTAAEQCSINTADINNDGLTDIVATGRVGTTSAAAVMLGTGNGNFASSALYSDSSYFYSRDAAFADLNGDNVLDMVLSSRTMTAGKLSARLGNGDGSFRGALALSTPVTPMGATGVVADDLNQDGIVDLAIGIGANAYIMLGNGDATFSDTCSLNMNLFSSSELAAGDLNGDGIFDLIQSGYDYPTYAGRVVVALGKGDGSFTAPVSLTPWAGRIQGTALGDVNSDGVLDVFAVGANASQREGYAVSLLGNTRAGVSPILPFSLKTRADALQAIPLLSQTQERLASQLGTIGAIRSRVETAINNLRTATENFDSARSRITDVDTACEAAALVKGKILEQAASAILGQANQSPALALNLLRS